ncbi:MAG: HAMP domain-containing sensor histidine kinase [Paracoccaceae bacterium]
MTDLSWLDHVPTPAFAFKADDKNVAHILFWNLAMEGHSQVPSEMATDDKLAVLSQRLLRASKRRAKSASLGSLGSFEFKVMPDGVVIATLSGRVKREAEDEKVMFLAMAAHDLRSPRRQIRNLLDEVREGFQDMGDSKLELLNMIEEVGERARVFTNDVITYTWATHIQQAQTDRLNLLEYASDIFQTVDPSHKHDLTCPEITANTDKLALQIALRNLFDNAVRHGGKTRMMISLQVEEVPEMNTLRFTVVDDGKGLASPADFFITATDLRKSSSFGLMGVKRLIEERGGEISAIEPREGSGSAITFTLPGNLVNDAADKAASA